MHKAFKRNGSAKNLEHYVNICELFDIEIQNAYESYNAKIENNLQNDPKAYISFANSKLKTTRTGWKTSFSFKETRYIFCEALALAPQ